MDSTAGKHKVWIKRLSGAKQARLMKGGAVRIHQGDEQVMVLPADLAKKILAKFAKGKAHNLSGSGLYEDLKGFGGSALKAIKPFAEQAYDVAKPMARQAISTAVDYGTPLAQAAVKAGIASGTAALSAAQPQFAPFIIPAGLALGSMSDDIVSSLGQYAKKTAMGDSADIGTFSPQNISAYQSFPSVQYAQKAAMQDPRVARAMETMQQYNPSQLSQFQQMAPQLALRNYVPQNQFVAEAANVAGLQEAANIAKSVRHKNKTKAKNIVEKAKVIEATERVKRKTRQQGKGLYAAGAQRGRGMMGDDMGILGIGGSMVSPFGDHPAMESMPLSYNFASRAFRMPTGLDM
jgi:hypothetical protein